MGGHRKPWQPRQSGGGALRASRERRDGLRSSDVVEDVSSDGEGEDAREGGPVLFEPGEAERRGVLSLEMRVRIVRVLEGVTSVLMLPLLVGVEVVRIGVLGSGAGLRGTPVENDSLGTAGRLLFLVARVFDFESFCLVRKSIFSTARSL